MANPKSSRTSRCSWPRRAAATSPARSFPWTAGSGATSTDAPRRARLSFRLDVRLPHDLAPFLRLGIDIARKLLRRAALSLQPRLGHPVPLPPPLPPPPPPP